MGPEARPDLHLREGGSQLGLVNVDRNDLRRVVVTVYLHPHTLHTLRGLPLAQARGEAVFGHFDASLVPAACQGPLGELVVVQIALQQLTRLAHRGARLVLGPGRNFLVQVLLLVFVAHLDKALVAQRRAFEEKRFL